jgi:DNA-directed RNA polymerase subunit RPC12/RpoP
MNTSVEFQMVCSECGSLTIKIENPESTSRGAVVYCGHCGAPRGTVGALRDLADRPNLHAVRPTRPRL